MIDKGHQALIADLKKLLREAEDYHFHDFKNKRYATPKVAITRRLEDIRINTINGKYDN
jgi:hypothetical protein